MESKLVRKYGAWEYTSKSGLKYTIGEVTAEFNVIIDDFEDVMELFDTNVLIQSHMVTYVYGDIEHGDEEERNDIKEWIDAIIDQYEKHERKVQFYRNVVGRDDINTLYECYIGTEKEIGSVAIQITKDEMIEVAEEDRH